LPQTLSEITTVLTVYKAVT